MKIGLFVPCYVDALYPEVGVATYKLLRSLGVEVDYPESQTCCGQPMGNAGFENMSGNLAEKYDDLFSGFDYVVAPSASCAAYVRLFHPEILKHDCVAAKKTLDLVRSAICSALWKESPSSSQNVWTNAVDSAVCSVSRSLPSLPVWAQIS